MRGKRHQAPVAPALALRKLADWRTCATLGLNRFEHRTRPIDPPLYGRENPGIDGLVPLDVGPDACRRIEIDGLERAHERPTQGKPVPNADIDVLRRYDAFGDEPERLFKKRSLHTVHDKAVDLALHDYWRMAGRAQERRRPFDRGRVGPRGRDHFRGGNQIGRIDRVNDHTPFPPFERLGEFRGQNRRGRTRKYGARVRNGIEPRKYLTLQSDVFGGVLLNMLGAGDGFLQRCRDVDSIANLRWRSAVQQIVCFEVRQQTFDVGDRGARRPRSGVPERY